MGLAGFSWIIGDAAAVEQRNNCLATTKTTHTELQCGHSHAFFVVMTLH